MLIEVSACNARAWREQGVRSAARFGLSIQVTRYFLLPTQNVKESQSQNTLFSLGMFTYTYERQDIIQIPLKRLPGVP
jgi:hypothetical protein